MNSLFKSLYKRTGGGVFSIVLLTLLLTGCPKPTGSNNEGGDEPKKETELDFEVQEVGMAYCIINWNWLEGYYFQSAILSTTEDFSSGNRKINDGWFWNEDDLPYKVKELKPGTDYYIKLIGSTAKNEDLDVKLSFHTSDKGPLDNLEINFNKDSKRVEFSYDYVRDAAKVKFIKAYRKLQTDVEWTLITEGEVTESKVWDGFEDYEYTPNVENLYKIELYDENGNNLGADVTSELSITPEDEDDVLDIKVADRGYSYLDLLWDYSLYDSYKITYSTGVKSNGQKAEDSVEYASNNLPADKAIHFYFSKELFRSNYSKNVTFTIECYKSDTLEKTVKRNFEINKTGAPEDLISKLGDDKITLQWNSFDKSNDAFAKVYRRTSPDADYEEIGSQKYWASDSNEFAAFDDETFVAGTTNYYKIELYEADGLKAGDDFFGSAEVSCDASSKCSITFDLGEKRNTNTDKERFVYSYFDKGTDISTFDSTDTDFYVLIGDDYKDLYEVDNYTWLKDGVAFDFNTTLSSNIVLTKVYKPKKPSATKFLSESDKIYLRWNKMSDFSYKVEYGKTDGTLTTIDCGKETGATLKNLENGQEYTINIYSVSEDNITSYAATKKITTGTPQNTEWLVIMYMDGDNNLNNPIYLDMNEVEYGLSKFTTTDHIRVIALWDGYAGDNKDNPASSLWGNKETHIYELGPDPRTQTSAEDLTLLGLADTTFDWTFSADWIENDEVDMSSKTTLQNYLEWVKAHFSGTKTILQFSNHGAGPRSILPNDDRYGRRAMCWDEGSGGTGFLKTKDVSDVLATVDLKNGSKIDLIIEDVCLGSTIEEAYQYKDYAQYFIGSPNTVPGFGLDYDIFIPSMKSGASVLTISKDILKSYKASYALSNAEWAQILNEYNSYPAFSGSLDAKGISLVYEKANGLTLANLSAVGTVEEKLDALAGALYELKDKTITLTDSGNLIEGNFLEIVRDNIIRPGNPIYYQGSYTWLYDIGAIIDGLEPFVDDENIVAWMAANSSKSMFQWAYAVGDLKDAMSNAIAASWRDGYQKPSYDTTVSKYSINAWIGTSIHNNYYGLSICGGTVETSVSGQTVTLLDEEYPDFYGTELQFGQDCENWDNLLKLWFPAD